MKTEYNTMSEGFTKSKYMAYEFLRHAVKYRDMINVQLSEDSTPEKAGNLAGWDIMIEALNKYARYALDNEQAKNLSVIMNVDPVSHSFKWGITSGSVNAAVTLYNRIGTGQSGKLEVLDDSGKVLQTVNNISVSANGKTTQNISVSASRITLGTKIFKIRFTTGTDVYESPLEIVIG